MESKSAEFIPPYPYRMPATPFWLKRAFLARRNLLSMFEEQAFEYEVAQLKVLMHDVFLCNSPDSVQFAFSTHNALGCLLSPRGLRSAASLRTRWHVLMRGGIRNRYVHHPGGLLLYYASPAKVIRQVEGTSLFRLRQTLTTSGLALPLPLIHIFSSAPHYVFTRDAV